MRRFFGNVNGDMATIEGEEFVHLKTVLRGKIGEKIVVIDGSENEYICVIEHMNKNYAQCSVIDRQICKALPKKNIVLFQGLIKRDKLEEVLQRSVEIGVKQVVPFESEYCVIKPTENKKDRLEKIVLSACKQCERSVPMEVCNALSFAEMKVEIEKFKKLQNSIVLFANERDGKSFDFSVLKNCENIAVVVGPEGGFSAKEKEELSLICESISLGERIYRSETASIVLCGIASVISGN